MNDTLKGNNSTPPPALKPSSTVRNGFSLVEVIVVGAILLILLAIAVPEFQEARTVSNYVQAKSDIHSLVVAQEAYYQDFGTYPTESESDAVDRGRNEAGLFWLTSPIPYIDEIPIDPFLSVTFDDENQRYETGGIEAGVTKLSCPFCLLTWVVFSPGPNTGESLLRPASPHYTSGFSNRIQSYSPTNGTMSYGPIFQYGGDPFWIGVSMSSGNRTTYAASSGSLEVGLTIDHKTYLHRLPPPLK